MRHSQVAARVSGSLDRSWDVCFGWNASDRSWRAPDGRGGAGIHIGSDVVGTPTLEEARKAIAAVAPAGEGIICGSYIEPFEVVPGDLVEVDAGRLGRVSVPPA